MSITSGVVDAVSSDEVRRFRTISADRSTAVERARNRNL
jgi:hypothetical protein